MIYKEGNTPPFTDIRHFFYECRNKFLRQNPQFDEIDSTSKFPYIDWQKTVNSWCAKKCKELNIEDDLYWRVREELNIWAEGRAVVEGEVGKFLVDKDTREKVGKKCSFILCCEKKTVSKELLNEMQDIGYKLNLISTAGHSTSDVQEAILEISESLDKDNQNFYILVLHDYDLAGVQIYFTLAKRHPQVIDCGINQEFLDHIQSNIGLNARFVEETVVNKQFYAQLKDAIETNTEYNLDDFDYLQGEKIEKKRWIGKRIEIDAVHVEHGIQPFIKYIFHQIKRYCKCWDLSRIGVEEYELEKPTNEYYKRIDELEIEVGREYGRVLDKLSQNRSEILEYIKGVLKTPEEYIKHREKYLGKRVKRTYRYSSTDEEFRYEIRDIIGVDELKEDYEEHIEKDWREDYEDDLDELNALVENYCGDILTAEEELEEQFTELQEKVKNVAEEDENLEDFEEELETVETGIEELKNLKSNDLKADIEKVINTLQEWIKQLEEE